PGIGLVGGSTIVVVGAVDAPVSLGGSKWAVDIRGHRGGRLPDLDYTLHLRLMAVVAALVTGDEPLVDGVHDVSDGGIGLALAEMAVSSGVGFRVRGPSDHVDLFGEGPSRVALSVPPATLDAVESMIVASGLGIRRLGEAGGDRLVVEELVDVSLEKAQ